jgi:hypothetical protein
MNKRKIAASILILIALIFGIIFCLKIELSYHIEAYFKKEYYTQFGPLSISIELLIAGIYLFIKHAKTNFALALFGFTALLDPFFNLIGLFTSNVSIYAMVVFVCCGGFALWLAFTNTYKLGRISFIGAIVSFIIGTGIELFFNYL